MSVALLIKCILSDISKGIFLLDQTGNYWGLKVSLFLWTISTVHEKLPRLI